MIAKDLVVLGNARILGSLYVSNSSVATSATAAASYSTRMLSVGQTDTEPSNEGEVYWYYE